MVLDDAHLFELGESRVLTLLADLALAGVRVKVHVQSVVVVFILLHRQLSPHPPVCERRLIALLHTLEERGSFCLDGGVFFCIGIDLDVDMEEMLDRIFL